MHRFICFPYSSALKRGRNFALVADVVCASGPNVFTAVVAIAKLKGVRE